MATVREPLRVAVLLGSTRTVGPPVILGQRVAKFVRGALSVRGHIVDVVSRYGLTQRLKWLGNNRNFYNRSTH